MEIVGLTSPRRLTRRILLLPPCKSSHWLTSPSCCARHKKKRSFSDRQLCITFTLQRSHLFGTSQSNTLCVSDFQTVARRKKSWWLFSTIGQVLLVRRFLLRKRGVAIPLRCTVLLHFFLKPHRLSVRSYGCGRTLCEDFGQPHP